MDLILLLLVALLSFGGALVGGFLSIGAGVFGGLWYLKRNLPDILWAALSDPGEDGISVIGHLKSMFRGIIDGLGGGRPKKDAGGGGLSDMLIGMFLNQMKQNQQPK